MADETLEQNEEDIDFSLADLAELDASEIAEVRFEQLPAGTYRFRGVSAGFIDTENAQDERRIVLDMKFEVVECKHCLERGVDKEDLIGKRHGEKQYVVPAKATEGLGLIRAFIGDIGLPNSGPFGGVEGKEPGIVDGIVDHEFDAKIVKKPRKGDPTTKDSRMQLDPPKKKAA